MGSLGWTAREGGLQISGSFVLTKLLGSVRRLTGETVAAWCSCPCSWWWPSQSSPVCPWTWGSGVWDSPMATDYYVRQFGWLFGGGRSGVEGVNAMVSNRVGRVGMKYSSPYKYEYD